jgi:hypothetical protein
VDGSSRTALLLDAAVPESQNSQKPLESSTLVQLASKRLSIKKLAYSHAIVGTAASSNKAVLDGDSDEHFCRVDGSSRTALLLDAAVPTMACE